MGERKEILLVPAPPLLNDRLFSIDGALRSLEISKPFIELRKDMKTKGFDVKTIDMADRLSDAHAVVFFEVPRPGNPFLKKCLENGLGDRLHVMVGEPPAVYPEDHDPSKHGMFRRIMTFNSEMVDGKKYIGWNYTIPIRAGEKISIPRKPFKDQKLLCLVSSNKFSSYSRELYGERVMAVRFMERRHPSDFDLFGIGWDIPMIHDRTASAIKLNGVIWRFWPKSLTFPIFPSYRKGMTDKKEILPKYRFTIAYENCITPGYISEKMLEAMLYGCVPVYLGDPGIEKRIPKDCFIDKREYKTYEELYARLKSMGEDEHAEYLDRIETFINSKGFYPFTIDAFIESFEKMVV